MNKASPFIIIVVILGSVFGLIMIGNNLVENVVENSLLDVDVAAQVSGNDILVTIHGGDDLPRVTKIHVRIEGMSQICRNIDRAQFEAKKTVVCTDLAKGVKGNQFVIVEGTLTDDSIVMLDYHRILFT